MGAFYFDQSLSVINDLVISIEGDDIILNWPAMTGTVSYSIYRSPVAYFDISTLLPIGATNGTTFTDTGAVSGGSWFYVVTWVSEL